MLQLKPRQAVEEAIENWDDDDLDIGGDDFAFPSRATSIATTGGLSHHRESISSRLSIRSDFDSNHGDEERHVQVPGHDERSRNDAIAAATRAGIPLPQNVPTSALMGGTIKRLGGRKVKRIIQQDDWDDELELPGPGQGGFQIKRHDPSEFPDTLRQVSGSENSPSPAKKADFSPEFHKFNEFDQYATIRPKAAASVHINLEMFRDNDDDDDFFGGRGGDTIKVAKKRLPRPVTVVVPPTPVKRPVKEEDDFESDFQLPTDGKPLRLSIGKDIPMTPVNTQDDFDEWAEGSLGTRFGGTRRSDGRSNRSSSASALSPSVSSSITIESEDEGLDGLVLPSGPLNFEDILKRRQQTQSPEHEAPLPAIRPEMSRPGPSPLPSKDDLLSGLEIGDGDVFNSNGRTLNRNVKVKTTRQLSPQRPKIAVSLKFTDKPSPPVNSRLPRPLGHERHASNLDPVFESGGPLARAKRSQSRLGGHSAQSSVSSIPAPATPTSAHSLPPSTPRRRDLAQKPSLNALRNEPTTTNAQLLKLKRSMPIIRNTNSPAKPMMNRYERPSSRTDNNSRPNSMIRPKTPIERDRSGAESSMSRRNPVPFLPAGNSSAQSHHVTIKTSRHFRQNDSMSSNVSLDLRSTSRAMSRATIRSPSPNRARLRGPEALAREAASKRQLTKPSKQRHFGDGRELDGFDDLPTSQTIEQKYIKQPIGRGPPKALLRNKVYQNNPSDRTNSSTPLPGPYSPARYENRYENLPRFARDTNASRMAREQVLSQRQVSHGRPLSSLTNQWKAQVAAKTGLQPIHPPQSLRAKKSRSSVQQKPHLIKPLSDMSKSSKSVKGMIYNPSTFRWEGNENDLSPFDAPTESPSTAPIPPPYMSREKENNTPRPALITNINASQGVQVVGGMVFDPQRMCWLKVPHHRDKSRSRISEGGDTMDGFDDEEDVFKDVPDLEDKPSSVSPDKDTHDSGGRGKARKSGGTEGGGGLKDDWLVGEEFDVGPEFVRRQREEEERWRRKVERWIGEERDKVEEDSSWRWRIRDVVNEL